MVRLAVLPVARVVEAVVEARTFPDAAGGDDDTTLPTTMPVMNDGTSEPVYPEGRLELARREGPAMPQLEAAAAADEQEAERQNLERRIREDLAVASENGDFYRVGKLERHLRVFPKTRNEYVTLLKAREKAAARAARERSTRESIQGWYSSRQEAWEARGGYWPVGKGVLCPISHYREYPTGRMEKRFGQITSLEGNRADGTRSIHINAVAARSEGGSTGGHPDRAAARKGPRRYFPPKPAIHRTGVRVEDLLEPPPLNQSPLCALVIIFLALFIWLLWMLRPYMLPQGSEIGLGIFTFLYVCYVIWSCGYCAQFYQFFWDKLGRCIYGLDNSCCLHCCCGTHYCCEHYFCYRHPFDRCIDLELAPGLATVDGSSGGEGRRVIPGRLDTNL